MVLSRSDKLYQLAVNAVLLAVTVCAVLPLVLLLMSSITDENTLVVNGYSFFPEKFSTAAYRYILTNGATIFRAYGITITVTAAGTVCTVVLSSLTAFPLTLKELAGRRVVNFYIFFTMLFNGGLVPAYIMWNGFGVRNTLFAYLLPNFFVSAFNVILMRTYFATSIPYELYESAKIDGAGYFSSYLRLALPLGKPILVTVGLFAGLTYWNDWTNGLYYITTSRMFSIQVLLNRMVQDIQALAANSTVDSGVLTNIPQVSIRMAIAFVAILPILLVYPFLQKYFASGIMLGALKG